MPKANRPAEPRAQHATLPYRPASERSDIEILLITSRETRRWVIPKGWPMRGRKGHQAAAREAYEEAGLVGKVAKRAIGAFTYDKRLRDGSVAPCRVHVFPFLVSGQRERWPEMDEREARWFTPEAAAGAVQEPELAALIRGLAELASDPKGGVM